MNKLLGIKEIWQVDNDTLGIVWSDNFEAKYDVQSLREKCPCALCVDEFTGKKKAPTKKDLEKKGVRPLSIKSVGRYALSITFSDGHSTGIYTFNKLYKML